MENLIFAFFISIVGFSIGLFSSFLYLCWYNMKLGFYLKKEKYDKWRELTTVGSFGPGGSNPFRGLPYIYSEEDNEDKTIKKYKDNIKLGIRYSLFIFIALVINIIILLGYALHSS